MFTTFIDIESTGFDKHRDTVLSVGYLVMSDDLKRIIDADVMYFYQEGQTESCPQALAVHGLTKEFLKQYEGQYTRNLQKLFKIFTKASVVGHNSDFFDIPFIRAFLLKNGYGEVQIFQGFDTMKIYQPLFGRSSLGNIIKYLKIPEDGVKVLQNHYFKGKDIRFAKHDATYDVTATLIAFSEAKRRNMV